LRGDERAINVKISYRRSGGKGVGIEGGGFIVHALFLLSVFWILREAKRLAQNRNRVRIKFLVHTVFFDVFDRIQRGVFVITAEPRP